METKPDLSTKDWLELAWKYFQLHAQQRISFFNFFVIFSTVLTTAFVNALNSKYLFIGVIISSVEVILAFIFLKIENRNKFLTNHAKNVILKIEKKYFLSETENFSIFQTERIETDELNDNQKKKFFLKKEITSHGYAYRFIYLLFFIIGIFALIWAIYLYSFQ